MISMVLAMDKNNGIGINNKLLAYIPGDLPRFKKLTTGKTIIMGRKTFDSLPNGALPNRENIVISRNRELLLYGVTVFHSLKEAIESTNSDQESFIIGGGEIYKQSLVFANKLYITHIDKEFEADTFFPQITSEWKKISEDIQVGPDFSFRYSIYTKD